MRPADLPRAETRPHGTRSRYVSGCRCRECRAANSAYYHQRQKQALEAAADLHPVESAPVEQEWTAPDGTQQTRIYKRACPGVDGEPCPNRSHLRADSKGTVCRSCRARLIWNGLVSAKAARKHILALSRQGVGKRAVADASGVGLTTISEIRSGEKTHIRRATSRAICAVDAEAIADGTPVPAERPIRLIRHMMKEGGFKRYQIAERLGVSSGNLPFGQQKVTAHFALRVEKTYRDVMGFDAPGADNRVAVRGR